MILLNKNNLFFGFTLDLDFEDKKQKLYGISKIILLKNIFIVKLYIALNFIINFNF